MYQYEHDERQPRVQCDDRKRDRSEEQHRRRTAPADVHGFDAPKADGAHHQERGNDHHRERRCGGAGSCNPHG